MGKPMATNLIKANHQLIICDINPKPVEELAKMGAIIKEKPSEILPSTEVIFLSLPSHIEVEEVMLGPDGVLSTLKKGQMVIDTTTSLPSVSRRIAEKVKAKKADFLDASVSGGVAGAAAQTLAIMVGGEMSVLERVRGLLETIGKKIFYMGPHGSGNTAKLINNLISITNTVCFIEGMVLGTKAGLNPSNLFDVISASTGNSFAFQGKVPRILNRDFKPTFSVDLECKDLYLVSMLAQELKVPVFLGSVAKNCLKWRGQRD